MQYLAIPECLRHFLDRHKRRAGLLPGLFLLHRIVVSGSHICFASRSKMVKERKRE
jgi:hypothetical protein